MDNKLKSGNISRDFAVIDRHYQPTPYATVHSKCKGHVTCQAENLLLKMSAKEAQNVIQRVLSINKDLFKDTDTGNKKELIHGDYTVN